MQNGTIINLTDKGYGFIKPKNGGDNIFFHARDLFNVKINELVVGDPVDFNIVETPKGLAAVNVTLI